MNDDTKVRWMLTFFHSEGGARDEPDFPKVDFWHPTRKAAMEAGARVLKELKERGDERDWKAAGFPDPYKTASIVSPNGQWVLPEPPPKLFDPDKMPKLDLTEEEWESFHSAILEGRGRPVDEEEEAHIFGRLMAVDWGKRTAELHRYHDKNVALRFDASLDEDMRRHATRYVKVVGQGKIDATDNWTSVKVARLEPTRSWREPFDVQAMLNDPNPKLFDPDNIVRVSEPFDVDEFLRFIREGRDFGSEEVIS